MLLLDVCVPETATRKLLATIWARIEARRVPLVKILLDESLPRDRRLRWCSRDCGSRLGVRGRIHMQPGACVRRDGWVGGRRLSGSRRHLWRLLFLSRPEVASRVLA